MRVTTFQKRDFLITQKPMAHLPWQKWFPSDWLADPALSLCSAATRGIWMDALCAMMLNNTDSMTGNLHQFASVCRARESEVESAIAEFESCKVCEVQQQNGFITLTCRRLSRNLKISMLRSQAANSRWSKSENPDAKVMQTPMQNGYAKTMQCTMQNPASASASASASVLKGSGETFTDPPKLEIPTRLSSLRSNLNGLFHRPDSDHWSYEEETYLSDICRRVNVISEFQEILKYRSSVKPDKSSFVIGQTLSKLLQNWTSALDQARNSGSAHRKPLSPDQARQDAIALANIGKHFRPDKLGQELNP